MTEQEIKQMLADHREKGDYRIRDIVPATESQLQAFIENAKNANIDLGNLSDLIQYYKVNNNFFGYFACDDIMIFEWYEDEQSCLWLGCVDMNVFRYFPETHKWTIGNAGDDSYGKDYEFNNLKDMFAKASNDGMLN